MNSERIVYTGRESLINHATAILASTVVVAIGISSLFGFGGFDSAAFCFLIAAGIAGAKVAGVYGSHYTVTSDRVVQKTGLVSRHVSAVEVADIRNVQVSQNVIQRVFGIGDVGISSAGQSDLEIVFRGIRKPQPIADLIRQQRKAAA